MSKLETFEQKRTRWAGVWRSRKTGTYTSGVFTISDLQKFKGPVRLWLIPNRYKKEQKENAPTHLFMIQDAEGEGPIPDLEIEDIEEEETFSYDEVYDLLRRCRDDCYYHFYERQDSDWSMVLPEDYI